METIKENFIFKKAYNKGTKQAGKYVVLYSLKRKSGIRYGVTVSKKIGKAVVRNRLRRQFRECLRILEPYIGDGQDIVLVARSAAVYAPYSALLDSIRGQMIKGGMLNEEALHSSH
ncbi:MAG: ribonuclease P protein component [Clostridia bacterium]|nr:ribonuclease P protein component [Clostridia bacterium]